MQKISPCLWFDKNAEDAVQFISRFLKTQRLVTLLDTEKKGMSFIRNRKVL